MKNDNIKTNAGLFAGTSLAILSTTCCALPIVLVSLGLGGAMASLVSNVPWLITISKYKAWTFTATAGILGYCWFALGQLNKQVDLQGATCSMRDRQILKWQKRILWFATIILGIAVFTAYALLPIRMWLDSIAGS